MLLTRKQISRIFKKSLLSKRFIVTASSNSSTGEIGKGGYYTHNFHSPHEFYFLNRKHTFDSRIQKYEKTIQAFLNRRRTTKQEIPGKISIIEALPEYANTLSTQKLSGYSTHRRYNIHFDVHTTEYSMQPIKPKLRQLSPEHSEQLHLFTTTEDENTDNIKEPAYDYYEDFETALCENLSGAIIVANIFQPYEKQIMDLFVQKVILNGQYVALHHFQQHQLIRSRILELFHVFYHGDPLTPLEKELERRYLAIKYRKYIAQIAEKELQNVVWSASNLNRLQGQTNYRMTDPSGFHIDRPIYDEINVDKMMESATLNNKILGVSRTMKTFVWLREERYVKSQDKSAEMEATYLIQRIVHYLQCPEFTRILEIENDYQIFVNLINMHIWLLQQRLDQFEDPVASKIKIYLTRALKIYINKNFSQRVKFLLKSVNIKWIPILYHQVRALFDYHFFLHPITSKNPYILLIPLLKSVIYNNKPASEERLIKLGDYLVKSFEAISILSLEDIRKCTIDWNCSKVALNISLLQDTIYDINRQAKEKHYDFSPYLKTNEFNDLSQFKKEFSNKLITKEEQDNDSEDFENDDAYEISMHSLIEGCLLQELDEFLFLYSEKKRITYEMVLINIGITNEWKQYPYQKWKLVQFIQNLLQNPYSKSLFFQKYDVFQREQLEKGIKFSSKMKRKVPNWSELKHDAEEEMKEDMRRKELKQREAKTIFSQ